MLTMALADSGFAHGFSGQSFVANARHAVLLARWQLPRQKTSLQPQRCSDLCMGVSEILLSPDTAAGKLVGR